MKITYATYVDNQPEINYPVKFLLRQTPQMVVYASDNINSRYLSKIEGIESIVIDHNIRTPEDISIAQNKCIDHLFETTDTDFVVWVQADTYITTEGHDLIKQFCTEENLSKSAALNLTHLRLFHICHQDYFGVTIFGRGETARFTGDGAHTPITGENQDVRLGSATASIDIGYLSIRQCRNHLTSHEKTWGYNEKSLLNADKEFVNEYLKKNDVQGIIQQDDIFYQLIEKMNLVNEYNQMKVLVEGMEFSKNGRLTAI